MTLRIPRRQNWAAVYVVVTCFLISGKQAFVPVQTSAKAQKPSYGTRPTRCLGLLQCVDHDNHPQDDITTPSSRRNVLKKSVELTAASSLLVIGNPVVAEAKPSTLSSLQGPLQDAIAPGHWIGQFLGLNSRQTTWRFSKNVTPAQASQALVTVLNQLTPEQRASLVIPELEISNAGSNNRVHVRTWTNNEWLDSLDVVFYQDKPSGECQAKASFYATGFLPTSIPGAPLFNIAFSWFPFASPGPRGTMLQDYRLQRLEALLQKKLSLQ